MGYYRVGMGTRAIHRIQYEYVRLLLVRAREASGLTQVEVAERLNKPQSFVSKCERGERRVDLSEFVEFADILGIDIPDFIAQLRTEYKRLPKTAERKGSR